MKYIELRDKEQGIYLLDGIQTVYKQHNDKLVSSPLPKKHWWSKSKRAYSIVTHYELWLYYSNNRFVAPYEINEETRDADHDRISKALLAKKQ